MGHTIHGARNTHCNMDGTSYAAKAFNFLVENRFDVPTCPPGEEDSVLELNEKGQIIVRRENARDEVLMRFRL